MPHPGAESSEQTSQSGVDLTDEPPDDHLYEPPPDPEDLDYGYVETTWAASTSTTCSATGPPHRALMPTPASYGGAATPPAMR